MAQWVSRPNSVREKCFGSWILDNKLRLHCVRKPLNVSISLEICVPNTVLGK